MVRPVKVDGPNPSAVPKVAMPTMRTVTGRGVSSVVVAPRLRCPSCAASRLMTASSSAVAGRVPTVCRVIGLPGRQRTCIELRGRS
jgi:hypothetical protein